MSEQRQLCIVGAGLAGLLAAHAWPRAPVIEAESGPRALHKALLRFRSDAVARLTGVEFRPVLVHKGIWFKDRFQRPSIQLANLYALKVTGSLKGDRSIWNLDSVKRFIAPENFYDQLIEAVGKRIHWGIKYDYISAGATVSTAPLPVVLSILNPAVTAPFEFNYASIKVTRYRVKDSDIYQTVYFPGDDSSLCRASITGSLLLLESMDDRSEGYDLELAMEAFGIDQVPIEKIDSTTQRYGKIVPLPAVQRRALLHTLTSGHGIFSLGRFATWRNILLDDVVQDIDVIRRLLKASPYERKIVAAGPGAK